MPKKWVVNASSLIVLARLYHLFLLQHVPAELVVPAGVAKEIALGPEDDPAKPWLQSHGSELVRAVQMIPPVIIAWNLGMEAAREVESMAQAGRNPATILTHDLDYGHRLAFSGATALSMMIFRRRNPDPDRLLSRFR